MAAREPLNLPPLQRVIARRLEGDRLITGEEVLAQEVPVAFVYNGRPHVVMMATPVDLEDLAIGFSVTEGIVARPEEVEIVDCLRTPIGISLQMLIPQRRYDAMDGRDRNLPGRTGCGLCGTAELNAAIRPVRPVQRCQLVSRRAIIEGFEQLASQQPLNQLSGALHAATAIAEDKVHWTREDVGRHNAVDKVFGATLRAGRLPTALLVTSRVSYEVVHKAAQTNCPVVAAISAPTALAVEIANEAGITLIGFAHDRRMTVYAGLDGMRLE